MSAGGFLGLLGIALKPKALHLGCRTPVWQRIPSRLYTMLARGGWRVCHLSRLLRERRGCGMSGGRALNNNVQELEGCNRADMGQWRAPEDVPVVAAGPRVEAVLQHAVDDAPHAERGLDDRRGELPAGDPTPHESCLLGTRSRRRRVVSDDRIPHWWVPRRSHDDMIKGCAAVRHGWARVSPMRKAPVHSHVLLICQDGCHRAPAADLLLLFPQLDQLGRYCKVPAARADGRALPLVKAARSATPVRTACIPFARQSKCNHSALADLSAAKHKQGHAQCQIWRTLRPDVDIPEGHVEQSVPEEGQAEARSDSTYSRTSDAFGHKYAGSLLTPC